MAPGDCNNVSVFGPGKQKVSVSDVIQIPIEELKQQVMPIIPSNYCIYKVPESLRKGNDDAYTPHLISIGPMHYDNPKLKPMEEHKILHLYYFRERVTVEQVLKGFMKYLEDEENNIRSCYSEKYPFLNKDKFVGMILLDAVFIMELFLRKAEEKDDYMFKNSLIQKEIERDLLLAENQLPFFVLVELYNKFKQHEDENFVELACKFFEDYNHCPPELKSAKVINDKKLLKIGWDSHPKHFTDLIRSFYISRDLTLEYLKPEKNWVVQDATKLKEAGITFEPVTDKGLLQVVFEKKEFLNWLPFLSCLPCIKSVKAHLRFPRLEVDDSTEYVLRNLMAFEQCHYPRDNYICSYARLIDMLIGEKNDVAVLVEKKIITNKLSSEKELTTLINKLCKNIVINSYCFKDLSNKLNKHYDNRWNKTVAQVRLVYFSNLWKGTGTVAAFVLLFISIFNFIRSNIEYF